KAKVFMQLADLQVEYQNYPEALAAVESAIQADVRSRGSSKLLLVKAQAEYETGRYAEAVESYEKLLKTPRLDAKTKARISFRLGMAAKQAGDSEKAFQAFKNASFGPYQPAAEAEMTALKR
ncbi:MAG: tetratricopeptide repeat protein, partial [Bacteroidota bacterium]